MICIHFYTIGISLIPLYTYFIIYLDTLFIIFIRHKISLDLLTLSLQLWRRCILTPRLRSIKKWSPVYLFHCRFSYPIYLSGSHFKEAQEKGRKVSVDFRIQYLKGNLSFDYYVAFRKKTRTRNVEAEHGSKQC